MLLSECEAIQLLNYILGNIGKKPLAERMSMSYRTVSDAIDGLDGRFYRDGTREETKLFLDRCLSEGKKSVSSYIASAYDWLKAIKPGYSDEILNSINMVDPKSMDGSNIDWHSIECGKDLMDALLQLSTITGVAEAVKQCIQIESYLEHKMRANLRPRANLDDKISHSSALLQYNKESRTAETARVKRIEPLPPNHVNREWLIKKIASAEGSVIAIEAPVGYGKTTLLESIASSGLPVATFAKCKWDDPARSEQMSILDMINVQLSNVSKSYRESIELLSRATESPSDKINSMTSAMLKAGESDNQVRYILIDALDELKDSQHIISLLDRLALASGYGWLKVVCSTRRWCAGREGRGFYVIRPLEETSKTENDIEKYALRRLSAESSINQGKTQKIASAIAVRSAGIFQYAVIVLDALCSGIVGMDDICDLPSDIFSLYDWYLARYLDGDSTTSKDNLITILNMVAASEAPVPEEIITCALSLGSRRWDKTKSSLDRFLVCTRTDSGTLYSLFHKSFADYLFSSRHGGKSAEEEGVAFLAMGCYRAKGLDRLSYWARDYIQVYLAWLLYRANNNALLDVPDFDLTSARLEVLHDEDYAKSCLDLFEPAQDVIVFQTPAREEVIAWSAMQVFDALLSQIEEQTGCSRCDAPKGLLSNWLFSCNHYVFVLVSASRFDEALLAGCGAISTMGDFDIEPAEASDDLEKEVLREYAVLYETIAYDVLSTGQPSAQAGVKISDYYDKAISIYAAQDDAEGYLKSACNKALYEVEHVDAKKGLNDIRNLVSSCELQKTLLGSSGHDELIEVTNPCRAQGKALIKAESAFNHMNNLGYCLTLAGEVVEGLQLFGICEALAFDKAGIDKGGPYSEHDKAELFHLEAIAFYRLGEYERVLKCEKRAIPGLQEAWGVDSPKLCGPYNMLGSARLSLGMIPEAIEIFERALSIATANWPPKHNRLVNIKLNLARAEIRNAQESDDPNDVKAALKRAMGQLSSVLAYDSPTEEPWEDPNSGFLKAQLIASEYLEADGRTEEAYVTCSKVVDSYRGKYASDSRSLGSCLVSLARLQMKLNRLDQARIALSEGMELLRETLTTLDGDFSSHPIWIQAASLADILK